MDKIYAHFGARKRQHELWRETKTLGLPGISDLRNLGKFSSMGGGECDSDLLVHEHSLLILHLPVDFINEI